MSSDIGDAISSIRYTATSITNFLYIDGKARKGIKEDITKEECIEILKKLERNAYDDYDNIAYYLGLNS